MIIPSLSLHFVCVEGINIGPTVVESNQVIKIIYIVGLLLISPVSIALFATLKFFFMARRYSSRNERYDSILNSPADNFDGIAEVFVFLPQSRSEKKLHFQSGAKVKNVKEKLRNTLGIVGGSLTLNSIVCLDHETLTSSKYYFSGFESGELQ